MDDACTLTVQEHIEQLFEVMAFAGLGGGCENFYRSLLEVAEACRIANNFDAYVPVLAEGMAAEAVMIDHNAKSGVVH